MTTLVAWLSFQNKIPSALTLASDSRLTWGSTISRWDRARKLYWSKSGLDMFGYAGDAITQTTLLSQICDALDCSALDHYKTDPCFRHSAFVDLIKEAFSSQVNAPTQDMITLHGIREDTHTGPKFRLWCTSYTATTGVWGDKEIELPDAGESFSIARGSGANKFKHFLEINIRKYGQTARTVFRSLIDTIGPDGDNLTGGIPQVVTLKRQDSPAPVGIVVGGQRYVVGMSTELHGQGGSIEWRDEKFEFLDKATLKKTSGSPKHYFW